MTSTTVQPFDFKGSQVRVLTDEQGEPWLVAKDICDVLGTYTKDLRAILDEDEISNLDAIEVHRTAGRPPLIISEAGFYKLVMRSRKPIAKEFHRWVTHDVLPSIRKHGAYMTEQVIERTLTDPDYLIRLATTLKEERAKRMQAEQTIKAQTPKVIWAQAVENSNQNILVGELAKILRQNGEQIGQNRLFRWLRENGYLMKRNGVSNMPTQKAMDLGLFRVVENTITHPDGHSSVSFTPKVTPKGQSYFINKFLAA